MDGRMVTKSRFTIDTKSEAFWFAILGLTPKKLLGEANLFYHD